jgi:hypothetical protein
VSDLLAGWWVTDFFGGDFGITDGLAPRFVEVDLRLTVLTPERTLTVVEPGLNLTVLDPDWTAIVVT